MVALGLSGLIAKQEVLGGGVDGRARWRNLEAVIAGEGGRRITASLLFVGA